MKGKKGFHNLLSEGYTHEENPKTADRFITVSTFPHRQCFKQTRSVRLFNINESNAIGIQLTDNLGGV